MKVLRKYVILLFIFQSLVTFSQERYIGKEFSIGIAPLYFAEKESNDIFGPTAYQEFIANLHFNARLSKNWFAGLRSHLIYVDQKFVPKYSSTNNITGLFGQYSFIASPRVRFSLELSFSYGDHCNCRPNEPLYKEDLFYLGAGFTADFQVFKKHPNWWLNVGFQTYHINGYYDSINSKMPVRLYALIGQYTASAIGVQYKFGDRSIFTKK